MLSLVGMAAHSLNGYLVGDAHAVVAAEIVNLREQVAESLCFVARTLMTAEHQQFVHLLVEPCGGVNYRVVG